MHHSSKFLNRYFCTSADKIMRKNSINTNNTKTPKNTLNINAFKAKFKKNHTGQNVEHPSFKLDEFVSICCTFGLTGRVGGLAGFVVKVLLVQIPVT